MIPFVGGSYQLKRKKADTQRSINLLVTNVESGSGKSKQFLKSIPGLVPFSVAGLTLTKTQDLAEIGVDETQTYTLTATNAGPLIADGATISDALPAGFTFTACTIVYAGGAAGPASATAAELVAGIVVSPWPINSSATLTITGTFAGAGTAVNQARIDFGPLRVVATATTTITVPPSCESLHPLETDTWATLTLTRYWECYSGPAITAKRLSDGVEQDIYFLEDGTLDVASLLTHAAGGDAYVSRWFDSSGHEHHFSLFTGQPNIVGSGVYLGHADFSAGVSFHSDDLSGSPVGITCFLNLHLNTGGSGAQYFYLLGQSSAGSEDGGFASFNNSNPSWDSAVVNDATHRKGFSCTLFGQAGFDHKLATRWDRADLADDTTINTILVDGSFLTGTVNGIYGAGHLTFTPRPWYFGGPGGSGAAKMTATSFLIYEVAKTDVEMLAIQGAW
jgi:uncharacterized repeat protein (TIGR01451 family)